MCVIHLLFSTIHFVFIVLCGVRSSVVVPKRRSPSLPERMVVCLCVCADCLSGCVCASVDAGDGDSLIYFSF